MKKTGEMLNYTTEFLTVIPGGFTMYQSAIIHPAKQNVTPKKATLFCTRFLMFLYPKATRQIIALKSSLIDASSIGFNSGKKIIRVLMALRNAANKMRFKGGFCLMIFVVMRSKK